jgi:hypothetical protein
MPGTHVRRLGPVKLVDYQAVSACRWLDGDSPILEQDLKMSAVMDRVTHGTDAGDSNVYTDGHPASRDRQSHGRGEHAWPSFEHTPPSDPHTHCPRPLARTAPPDC